MTLRRIPGTDRQYHLIAYDKRGREEPDSDGTSASERMLADLADPANDVTDVFILSHGWQGDYQDAIDQYDRWLGADDPDTAGDGIRPFVIGLHWPSKAWSDRTVRSAPSGLLGDEDEQDADAITVDEAVAEYAAALGDDPEVRDALRIVFDHVADIDPAAEASGDDALPARVADAYRRIAASLDTDAEEPLLGGDWDPNTAFAEAAREQPADDGLLGDGFFAKLRDAVLTPLRQLTFWHHKNRARVVGETGVADLVRAIMAATPARVHLAAHSFGSLVVSGAIRGPGGTPKPPPRPVDSLFLVQGALSLWAFSPSVPGHGGGRGYFAGLVSPKFVRGPIVATRSRWDYAVGRFYPLAVTASGEYLLGDHLPKFGGVGTFGIQGVPNAVELAPLRRGASSTDVVFTPGVVHNIDAQQVIAKREGVIGAHSDLAHPELVRLAWRMASPPA